MTSDRVLQQSRERSAHAYNGFMMLLVGLGLIVLAVFGGLNAEANVWGIVLLAVSITAVLLLSCGFYLLQPNQAAAILLFGFTALGVGAGVAMGAAMPAAMPFDLEFAPIAVASGLTILLGLIGAAVAVLRIVRIDPLRALGGQR